MRLLLCNPGAPFSVSDVFDGLAAGLTNIGHEVVVYDLTQRLDFASDYLTLLWKRRHEVDPEAQPPDEEDIVYLATHGILERASWYQPDAVLFVSGLWFPSPAIINLRRAGWLVGAVLTESPYNDDVQAKIAALCDLAWTNERSSVDVLRAANPNVTYLPAAFNPSRLPAPDPGTPRHDVVMVATGFPERRELIEAINWDGIDLGLYGSWSWEEEGQRFGIQEDSPLFARVLQGPIPNAETIKLYRNARIGLNLYRTCIEFTGEMGHIDDAESMNPRAYELAACGAFTISSARPEIREKFGHLVPTFETPQELEALIRHYLAHDDERRAIAARLPGIVSGETFEARAAQVVADIERLQRGRRRHWHATTGASRGSISALAEPAALRR